MDEKLGIILTGILYFMWRATPIIVISAIAILFIHLHTVLT